MDINQLRFLEEIEQDLYLESEANEEDQSSIIKTKYDMKSSSNVISNSMHEALGKPNLFFKLFMFSSKINGMLKQI
jgi:hypothetical protein